MRDYVISIADDSKVKSIIDLLGDLSYVKITEPAPKTLRTDFSLMNNPVHVEDFRKISREELHER